MIWSATLGPPCRMSRAWPAAKSALTSSRAISRATPPHCSANPAQEPTSPPPPIMLTFIANLSLQLLHDLFGNQFHQLFLVDATSPSRLARSCRGTRSGGRAAVGWHG